MRHLMLLAAAGAVVLSSGAAFADLGDQLAKLLADDGMANDNFGHSVAINGTIVIVGAWFADDNGAESGAAYLFDMTTGKQIAKLLPDDGAAGHVFGGSVAIGNAIAIVGAPLDDDNGTNAGSAYLFDTTTGQQIAKLLPKDGAAEDWFGQAVAISGTTAIVGARADNDNGLRSGSAYLFDTATGRQMAKLLPDDGAEFDEFGYSVAISGPPGDEIAIIGANHDDDNGSDSGSAYLFDATTGRQIAKLLPSDGEALNWFGHSVAISGNTAIVGAFLDNDNGAASGSAYLFDATTGRQLFKLLPHDGAAGDFFGFSVAISGVTGKEIAIVGARLDDDNGLSSGSAYLFDTTTGKQIAKLLPDDGAADDRFGGSVAISGAAGNEFAIVGAQYDDDNSINTGSAYLFDAAAPGMCPWDVNGDGVVDHHDLVEVVHNLGPCNDPDNCPWDVNGDGIVNGRDVAAVATHFGPCP